MAEKNDDSAKAEHDGQNLKTTEAITPASSRNFDETYEVYKRQDARSIDPREARRVLWKIDLHIIPLLMGTYMLQYLDKASINFAVVFVLEDGTHLEGQDYAWYFEPFLWDTEQGLLTLMQRLSSIFYFGEIGSFGFKQQWLRC